MTPSESRLFSSERKELLGKLAILVVSVLVLTVEMVFLSPGTFNPDDFVEGDVAKYTVRSPHDREIQDPISTEKQRSKARASVPKIFAMTVIGEHEVRHELDQLYETIERLSPNKGAAEPGINEKVAFQQRYALDLDAEDWAVLLNRSNWPKLKNDVAALVSPVLLLGVVDNKEILERSRQDRQPIVVKMYREGSVREEDSLVLSQVRSLEEASKVLDDSLRRDYGNSAAAYQQLVRKMSRYFLNPNVSYDVMDTTERMLKAEKSVPEVTIRMKKGEVIVRAGNVITDEHAWKIRQLFGASVGITAWSSALGYGLLAIIILLCSYFFAQAIWRSFQPRKRDLLVISLTLVGSILMLRLSGYVGSALEVVHPEFVTTAFLLASPIAAGGIMLQVTLGMPSVFIFILSLTLLTGVFLENSWLLCVLIFAGNIVGSLAMKKSGRRSAFLRAGIRVASVNVLIVICFFLLLPSQGMAEFSNRLLWSAAGGLLGGIIGIALTPMAEWIGGYVTDFKLLELASLDQPLLKELSVQAPGTWNHSMVIGQIGEAAAEAIGANALLTRVGAYYHDIGKIKKPAYFIENQSGKENRHDKLTPSMSALIVKAHVKDGVDMARKNGLPQALIDFIPQHHGTSLIEFFYKKAQEECGQDEETDETHYRYSGPKPQSREAGILMLADSVEASSRTLQDPTPAKIQGLVQKMINKIFVSGELEESHLTLKDLHLIAASFTRVLGGIYHRRIDYGDALDKQKERELREEENGISKEVTPGQPIQSATNEEVKDGSRSSRAQTGKQGSGERNSEEKAEEDSPESIKRLGI